ncbi:ABC transporter substrate-binding protein [Virgisporangium aliadipatigenens]|uniref:ABC transporter substrate-binding protein n=1 Tax=Virgisporangium aliadipatigenens TaxID=741659 RepID=UPI0019437BBA|nr:ABC transporter substrate-binding protein [Virgisporangium aliadipatigenens]
MGLSRRRLCGLLAAAAAGVSGCTAATKPTRATTLWYWSGGLSEKVVADAVSRYGGAAGLKPRLVEGNYKQQLVDVLTSGKDVPDIAGVKGEDIASLLPRADRFVDLNTLGAKDVATEYLQWKWQQGSTIDNRLVGFPIDIGPTALFYRRDLFERAGLPAEPADVSARLRDWESYLRAGEQLRRALPEVSLVKNAKEVFSNVLGQGDTRFVDPTNHFVGDGAHIRAAWDTAVRAHALGVSARIQGDTTDAWTKAVANGLLASELGAAWHALDIEQQAPETKGLWRVAAGPAAGANVGGSFLAIPAAGADHAKAFEIVKWILSPENQARGFAEAALFPSAPSAYSMPALTAPDEFFGGQVTSEVFAASAKQARLAYEAPADAAIYQVYVDELVNVEEKGKPADTAWNDAVAAGRRLAASLGVN